MGDFVRNRGWENVPLQSFRLKNIMTEYVFDMVPSKDVVGNLPYALPDGVSRTVAQLKQNNKL